MNSDVAATAPDDLEARVERWIMQRTSGRVRNLHVEASEQAVTVRGHAGSYYVRQLALAAVLEALEDLHGQPTDRMDFDVVVDKGWNTLSPPHDGRRV